MKELDPLVLIAVFQEMLGAWLCIGLAATLGCAVALVLLVRRERTLRTRRLVACELLGLLGGGLALVVMAAVSSSGFTDAGGPADWFLIAVVYGLGGMATTALCYAVAGWWQALSGAARSAQNGMRPG